jgi:hypothetical protein
VSLLEEKTESFL